MKYLNYIILAVLGLTFYSCDTDEFLNPLPDSAIVVDAFFDSDDDVLAGLIGVYDAIQGVNVNTESNTTRFNRGIQFEWCEDSRLFPEIQQTPGRQASSRVRGRRQDAH